jgi:Xaa-Pro aminopeptidase
MNGLQRLPILIHGLTRWDKTLMPESEVEARLARVREAIAGRGLDALWVYSNMEHDGNIAYLTNFHPFDPRMPGLALVTAENIEAVLKVSKRDLAFILTHIWTPAEPSDFLSNEFPGQVAAASERAGLKGKRIGFSGRALMPPGLEPQIIALFPQGVTEVDGMIEGLRRQKSAPERELLRMAAEKAESVIGEATAFAAAGMSENELAAYADYVARKAGALDVDILLHAAFEKMPPAGEHEQLPFRPPSERLLTQREHLGVYVAFQFEGYWAEVSDSIYVGGPSATERAARERCVVAFDTLCGSIGEGRQYAGVSSWTHGLGLERDELPLSTQGKAAAQPGDILAMHVALESDGARAFYGRTIDATAGRGVLITSAMQSA